MRDGWGSALICAVVLAVVLLALTPWTTLWDRDEPRFAQAAVEMLASGNYLVPTFNGELRAQKPPLIYWLMTLSIRVFGQTELAVRFWSPLALAAAALFTYAIGRRVWSRRVGLTAMIVLPLTPLALVEGIAATTDAVLLASITAAIAVGADALLRGPRWWHVASLGLAFGIGLLTKGPIAIAVPWVTLAAACWSARHHCRWRGRLVGVLTASMVIGVAIYAAWLVPASAATGGAIISRGLVRENLWRALEPMDGHRTPLALAPLYYPLVIAVGFAPWLQPLWIGVRNLAANWRRHTSADWLLMSWILIPLIGFTLAATKLPHYVFPIWPALALLTARGMVERRVPRASHLPLPWSRLAVTAVVLTIAVAIARSVERFKPVPHVAAAIRDSAVGRPLFVCGFDEPSLVFYSRRRVVSIGGCASDDWPRLPEETLLVAPRQAITSLGRSPASLGLREIAAHAGWNYVKGDRLELVAFVRARDR